MAEVKWVCRCGQENTDDLEETGGTLLCDECMEESDKWDVKYICWHCGDPIDPDDGPLCKPCYVEDQRWQYADICYDRMRGT